MRRTPRANVSRAPLACWVALLLPFVGGGCYRSQAPHDLPDGGGVRVTVLARDPSRAGLVDVRIPVADAYVVARPCGSTEQREARTDARGVAIVPFDAPRCWTVTAVHPALPFAVTHVGVDPSVDEPLVLSGTVGSSPAPDFAVPLPGSITGRAVAGSRVNLTGAGVLLGAGNVAGVSWSTTSTELSVFAARGDAAPGPTIYGVELDADAMPVGYGRSPFVVEGRTHAIDVGAVRGPVIVRDRTVTLPTTGALDLGGLVGLVASVERRVLDVAWPMRFGLGSFGAMERGATTVTHTIHLRELDVSGADEGLGDARDQWILQTVSGRAISCSSLPSAGEVIVPPLAEARVAITRASDFAVDIGGPAYTPRVLITRAPTSAAERTSVWSIDGTPGEVLRLTELPPLPAERGLASLALAGLRGARVNVSAFVGAAAPPPVSGALAAVACGVAVEPVEIAP